MPTLARYGDSKLPALVLLHGFLGSKADWLPLLPSLSQQFHCVCLDLPGHGEHQPALSAVNLAAGFDFCVQDILSRLDRLGLGTFHLYGYSLGGRIALHLAKAHPERLRSLLLESCHPGLTSAQERSARAEQDAQWAERLVTLSSQDFLTLWYQQAVFADMRPEQRRRTIAMRANMLDSHPKATLKAIYLATSLSAQEPLWDVPASLACPCHFFAGQQDAKFHTLAKEWQLQAPLQVHQIAGAGHNIHQSAPAALMAKLLPLLTAS